MAAKCFTDFYDRVLHTFPGCRPIFLGDTSKGLDLRVIDVGLNKGLFGIGLLARMAGKTRKCVYALCSFHTCRMATKLLEDCMLSPLVSDAIALVDISSLETNLAVSTCLLDFLFHADSEDKSNMAFLTFASSR